MDGFNVIPIDKDLTLPNSEKTQSNPYQNSNVEIVDEASKKAKASEGSSFFLVVSVFVLLGVIGYFLFLVFYRYYLIGQITEYGQNLVELSTTIDKAEMAEFRTIDQRLKAINTKLDRHVLNSEILRFINANIRSNVQVTEYRLDAKDKEVEVTVVAVAPSFKEFAEQTEKLFTLKSNGQIKSFSVSNMSFEADTRRLRFNTRIVFDRTYVSALFLSSGTTSQ